MKVVVISYTLTGNNKRLGEGIANALAVKHISINECKPRTIMAIILDLIFNRTPKVEPAPEKLNEYDFILFVGPIWMGKVATPLKAYLKYLKAKQIRYGFISISGGADGVNSNPNLSVDLKKEASYEPVILMDMHIADLLSPDTKLSRKETSAYKLTDDDIKKLTNTILKRVEKLISDDK